MSLGFQQEVDNGALIDVGGIIKFRRYTALEELPALFYFMLHHFKEVVILDSLDDLFFII